MNLQAHTTKMKNLCIFPYIFHINYFHFTSINYFHYICSNNFLLLLCLPEYHKGHELCPAICCEIPPTTHNACNLEFTLDT